LKYFQRVAKESEDDGRDDLYANESGGAGRFAFSIWRMLPPPARFRHRTSPIEKPLLQARYRLIYSRKVAIVDIKPATPTLYRKRVTCVALRWSRMVSVNTRHTSFTPAITVCKTTYCPLSYLFITSLTGNIGCFSKNRNS